MTKIKAFLIVAGLLYFAWYMTKDSAIGQSFTASLINFIPESLF